MPQKNLSNLFWFAARLWIGFVFAYAGLSKLIEPIENFRGAVAEYQVIPYAWVPLIAQVMPWVELVFGIFLMLGYMGRPSALVLSFLSLSFVVLIGLNKLLFGTLPASCGCFGTGGLHLTPSQVILLDSANFLLGLWLFISRRFPWSLGAYLSRR